MVLTTKTRRDLMALIFGVFAIVLTVLNSMGCGPIGKKILADVRACSGSAIQAEVTNVTPAVVAILQSGAADWDAQLKALESVGFEAVVCAVQAVIADLSHTVFAARDLNASIDPRMTIAVQRGQEYLAAHGVK